MKTKTTIQKIPDAELDVMLILWKRGKCRISEIYDELQSVRPCSKPAIHTLLERLSKKNFVELETVQDKTPYKTAVPLVAEEDYRNFESENIVNRLWHGSGKKLAASLIETGKLTEKDIEELAEMLKSKGE